MQVREAMTPSPATCSPETTLRLVAQLMSDHDCAAIPVTDSGKLVGIVTDRDIACRVVAAGKDAVTVPAADCMTKPVIAVSPDDDFELAVELMAENAIHHLPVISGDGALLGIVAQSDLGRRMSNRELGRMARRTSIRSADVWERCEAVIKP